MLLSLTEMSQVPRTHMVEESTSKNCPLTPPHVSYVWTHTFLSSVMYTCDRAISRESRRLHFQQARHTVDTSWVSSFSLSNSYKTFPSIIPIS